MILLDDLIRRGCDFNVYKKLPVINTHDLEK